MPSSSASQQRLMGADLARKRAGKPTRTGMSEKRLEDFASKRDASRASDQPAMAPAKGPPENARAKAAKSLIRR